MRAIVFNQTGDPQQVLQMDEIETPEPSDGQCLVKVIARPIEPADLAFIRGQYRIRPVLSQIAGLEGFGTVVRAALNAPFAVGARVAFRSPGTWAEFVAVPVERLIAVPSDIPDMIGCQISLNPVTSWALLQESKAVPGDWMLLTAAASTVSNLVASIASERGIRTIGLVRGEATQKVARAKSTCVLSIDDPRLIHEIKTVVGGDRVSALLDSVGGAILPTLFGALSPGAHVIAYGVQDRNPAAISNAMMIYSNLTWKGFGIDRWLSMSGPRTSDEAIQQLWVFIRNGIVTLPVDSKHMLADFKEGLTADARAGRSGKVILV
jgi:NADPH:quinone reductase-like Zn-dependent oxidoreductase